MKKIIIVCAAVVLLGAGTAYIVFQSKKATTTREDVTDQGELPSLEKYKDAAKSHAQALSRDASGKLDGVKMETLPSSELFSSDSSLIALSPDELAWMERHHYPTQAELDAIDTVSLHMRLGTPDAKVETLRGMALLKSGNRAGISVLVQAGAQGSIYAYQQAALAEYESNVKDFGNSAETQTGLRARLEVAKMLGDYRADDLIRTHLPDYDDRANAYALQAQVTEFMRNIGESTQLRDLPSTGPDPRPNEHAWADLRKLNAAGQSADVETYRFGK